MVENLSMPDLLKDVILIYFFCRALPIFFSVELHYPWISPRSTQRYL